MFRKLRTLHKWMGLALAVFLFVIAATGFVLSNKDRWEWVKPATRPGAEREAWASIITLERVAASAIGAANPEIRSEGDIDRIEYQASKNVFKVRSKDGFAEVQVCAATGDVLATGQRWDQFAEYVHDLRWFHPALRDYVLPVVAIGLAGLAGSGVNMYVIPVLRRRRFERRKRAEAPGESG